MAAAIANFTLTYRHEENTDDMQKRITKDAFNHDLVKKNGFHFIGLVTKEWAVKGTWETIVYFSDKPFGEVQ